MRHGWMTAATLLVASIAVMGGTSAASKLTVLHGFQSVPDGANPFGSVIADKAGNLYGTTAGGGEGNCGKTCTGFGTVYELAPGGSATVLYAFQGGGDGEEPVGALLMDATGNLYGTTELGGNPPNCINDAGCGVAFKLAPNGTETVLYTFQGLSDGFYPQGNLIADTTGNLYGVTLYGGSYQRSTCVANGCGTVFELTPNGNKTTLYTFQAGGKDGGLPNAGLIADAAGNLYGTTQAGGRCDAFADGCGTVFKIAPDGTETVLHTFQGTDDGCIPEAGLTADSAGNLYGTTRSGPSCGGNNAGAGTVFRLAPDGTETILYAFHGGQDGEYPEAKLTMDAKGNLYGTTYEGGMSNAGTVFELTATGTKTTLAFLKNKTGTNPQAGVLLGMKGIIYATAPTGRDPAKYGSVFEVKP